MRRFAVTLLTACVIAVGLVGCGSDENSGTSSASSPAGSESSSASLSGPRKL